MLRKASKLGWLLLLLLTASCSRSTGDAQWVGDYSLAGDLPGCEKYGVKTGRLSLMSGGVYIEELHWEGSRAFMSKGKWSAHNSDKITLTNFRMPAKDPDHLKPANVTLKTVASHPRVISLDSNCAFGEPK